MKESIKKYFETEVSQTKIPPMPSSRKDSIRPWENILLVAMAAAALVLIYLPESYNSEMRNLEVSEMAEDVLLNNLSRVVYEADLYFNEKRSQK